MNRLRKSVSIVGTHVSATLNLTTAVTPVLRNDNFLMEFPVTKRTRFPLKATEALSQTSSLDSGSSDSDCNTVFSESDGELHSDEYNVPLIKNAADATCVQDDSLNPGVPVQKHLVQFGFLAKKSYPSA